MIDLTKLITKEAKEAAAQSANVAAIQSQIDAIEQATMVPRVTREMMLLWADDMAAREAERLTAEGTPATKEQILAANSGYQKTLLVEAQIRALRKLL